MEFEELKRVQTLLEAKILIKMKLKLSSSLSYWLKGSLTHLIL